MNDGRVPTSDEISQMRRSGLCVLSGRQLTTFPPEIGQFTSLRMLVLDGNQLTTLPPEIGQLTNLRTLRLTANRLTTLPMEIGQLTSLQELWLDGNQLTTLPPEIGQLTNLRTLRLTANRLTTLPPEIADRLDDGLRVWLDDNPWMEPMPELIRQGENALAIYLRSLRDSVAQYEAKVLLIGEGNVGKTSLSAALRGDVFVERRPFTHGIEIHPAALHHPDAAEDMTIRLWDFGGQEVYRITHQFFFSQRALYLVVWKPREGQEQNEVEGWLRRIRLRVGPAAKVLIVATHCAEDQHPDLDYPHLQKEFPQMLVGHFEVDNQTAHGIPRLRAAIAEQVVRLPQMGQKISSRWVAVRDEIADLARTHPQISFQDFTALCQRHQVYGAEIGTLATLMHDLGQIIYYSADDGLQDFVVLNPEWLTKAISYVLRDDLTRYADGVLDHARLRDIWRDRPDGLGYPPHYHRYFLRLMEKFDISYRLENDEQRSLVAQLVPYQPPGLPWDSRTPLPGRLRRLALVCQLTEPAPGLMAWLTVRHHRAATGRHWRTGVFLRHPVSVYDSEALLELIAPTQLAVEVRAPSPDLYFHVLSDSIEELIARRWPGLSYELFIPCPGAKVDGSRCMALIPMNGLRIYRQEEDTHFRCLDCGMKHEVSVLLTGFTQSAAASQSAMGLLKEIASGVSRIEGRAADVANTLRQVLRVVSTEITDCPRLFTLTPVDHKGLWYRVVGKQRYHLVLWCEHPGHWHPWTEASYSINQSNEWVLRIQPYLTLVFIALRLVVPVAASVAGVLMTAGQLEHARSELELMTTLANELPKRSISRTINFPDEYDLPAENVAGHLSPSEGAALRGIRTVIFNHDPMKEFGGMRRVLTAAGDFLWVCPEHYADYDPGLPTIPGAPE